MKLGKPTLAVSAGLVAFALLPATPAMAAPTRENNPNAAVFTVNCPSGTLVGSAAPGGALLIEGGGVAVLQGLVNAQTGNVVFPVRPGLAMRGVLEECTYTSPFPPFRSFIAFVQIV